MDAISIPFETLQSFVFTRILSRNPTRKTLNLLARKDEQDAVVLLERVSLEPEWVEPIMSESRLKLDFQNDVYGLYACTLPASFPSAKATVIYPATPIHISKYSAQGVEIIRETPELYAQVTKPFIASIPASRIQWVYNILAKTAESERLLLEDTDPETGFMLHPDLKWKNYENVNDLYCLALCQRKDVKSIRDLRQEHIPMLKNIRDKCVQFLHDKFGIRRNQLRIYFHYQPSYYHLHIHFTHISFDAPGTDAGKAHLLDDVIDNIENVRSDYYAVKTLPCIMGTDHPLYTALIAKIHTLETQQLEENVHPVPSHARMQPENPETDSAQNKKMKLNNDN